MLDCIATISYLIITLLVGIQAGRGIKTMKDFSIASRTYPTSIMIATMCATIIGSGYTMGRTQKIFEVGILYVIVCMGLPLKYLTIQFFLLPGMQKLVNYEFVSAGDLMEHFYGKMGRLLSGICSALLCLGIVGAQVCALGHLCHHFTGLPYFVGILIGAGSLVLYSAFGGIKAVTMTDVIQFCMIIVIIPITGSVGLDMLGGWDVLLSKIPATHLSLTPPPGESIWKYAGLFFLFSMPSMDPSFVQRFLMARDFEQIKHIMTFTVIIILAFILCLAVITLSILAIDPTIQSQTVMLYFIDKLLPEGIRGLAIAGMIAVIMSTADSYLNTGSIAFVRDFLQSILKKPLTDSQELSWARYTTVIMGISSIVAIIVSNSILDIVLTFCNFWTPTINFPLMAAIFGYRGTPRAFIYAAITGASVAIGWMIYEKSLGFSSLIPALFANIIVFISISEYEKRKQRA